MHWRLPDKQEPYMINSKALVTDLIGIGKKMDDAKVEYGKAMNKLVDGRGNIVTSIQNLNQWVQSQKINPRKLTEKS